MAKEMTIGDLARATGTKVETVRYYERIGLMPAPRRTRGNYRSYSPEYLERLSFIRRSRELGFSVEQVRQLLGLSDDRSRPCDSVDEIAREHLAAVDRKLARGAGGGVSALCSSACGLADAKRPALLRRLSNDAARSQAQARRDDR